MNESVLVNFHCHSIFSDGELTPEALASNLASAGARYASLTDHDSLEGLPRFQEALKKHAVAYLPGVELTTQFEGKEAHLLGYGFDPNHPDLVNTLKSLRQAHELQVHSIAGSLRNIGTNHHIENETASVSVAPDGQISIRDAISLIHTAGGIAFWAHPLYFENDLEKLDVLVKELKMMGLDGLETVYLDFSETQRASLYQLAKKHDLLVSAGTDFHKINRLGEKDFAIPFPRVDWERFRSAFISNSDSTEGVSFLNKTTESDSNSASHKPLHFKTRGYILRIFLPTLIALTLFLGAIWGIILPSFEQTLLDRKRELIRELTNSALSILVSYEKDEENGVLTRQEAQALSIKQIEALRYGPESKDYFWIQDMQPRMIIHPYRSDLNGKDLRDFTDPRGVAIFVEFADLVRAKGEGYIDYVWQWKDDPQRLEPKESFVKGFTPWGWIIGTGLYTDDVILEIAKIEKSLRNTSFVISGAVILLLLFVLFQSLRIERERQQVLDELHDSTERYHTLVEATTEGTLLIMDDRCRYANPTFLRMIGYTARQIEFLELPDLLPREEENSSLWKRFEGKSETPIGESDVSEGLLRHADGHVLACLLAINPIVYAGQKGFILLARDLARKSSLLDKNAVSHAAQGVPMGIFRARASRRAPFLEMNPAMRSIIKSKNKAQISFAELFSDPADFNHVLESLQQDGEIKNHILHLESDDVLPTLLSLSARLVRDDHDQTDYIDGTLEDVTLKRRQEIEREGLIEKLQSSLLFLHEPISNLGRDVLVCDLDTSIENLTRQMTDRGLTAVLIGTSNATVIGIVTDQDLRARVLAEQISPTTPAHAIMSAPLVRISENALVFEALMRMEEHGIRHLAVEDSGGTIVSVVDLESLIQFQRYGPIVLTREISRSKTIAEVIRSSHRAIHLVKSLLDSSARPRHVTSMLSSACDEVTTRLLELAIAEYGTPPATFVYLGMGSQGRQEPTLVTDQDNGIIYEMVSSTDEGAVSDYFLQLGRRVSEGLKQAGYAYCKGEVMASNPRWCRSLPQWQSGFREWVISSEPQEIIDLNIFLDFRAVYGNVELLHDLRREIQIQLNNEPAFFHHLAQNALQFKPPFRLLGNIYIGGGDTEHSGEINLKDAMMPLVSFARLYALREGIHKTHTLERIESLNDRNVITPSSREEIIAAYDFLMQLRLQNQMSAIQAGRQPQNTIHPAKLGYLQQEMLKQAFTQIAVVQKRISFDFPGGE